MKHKRYSVWGILFCGSAVVLGAFGAHLLEDLLSTDALRSFEVGVRYQFYHGLALLFLSLAPLSKKLIARTSILFILGIILFSSSIYLVRHVYSHAVSVLTNGYQKRLEQRSTWYNRRKGG